MLDVVEVGAWLMRHPEIVDSKNLSAHSIVTVPFDFENSPIRLGVFLAPIKRSRRRSTDTRIAYT